MSKQDKVEPPHVPRQKVTVPVEVQAAFGAALMALRDRPRRALGKYPPETTSSVLVDNRRGTEEQRANLNGLYKWYNYQAFQNIENASIAFKALADHWQGKIKGKTEEEIASYRGESHSYELMKKIVGKYPAAVMMAKGSAERNGKVLIVDPEMQQSLDIVLNETMTTLGGKDADKNVNKLRTTLRHYPPGTGSPEELAVFTLKALASPGNALAAFRGLTEHWGRKGDEKHEQAYKDKSPSHLLMLKIARKYPSVVDAYAKFLDEATLAEMHSAATPMRSINDTMASMGPLLAPDSDFGLDRLGAASVPASDMPSETQAGQEPAPKDTPQPSILPKAESKGPVVQTTTPPPLKPVHAGKQKRQQFAPEPPHSKFLIGSTDIGNPNDSAFAPTQFADRLGRESPEQGMVAKHAKDKQHGDWADTAQLGDNDPKPEQRR